MLFTYRVDGCTLTEADKTVIEDKIYKLAKFGNRIDDESSKAHVEVFRGTRHNSPNFGVHAHIKIPRGSLDASASGKTIADAADKLEDKLRSQAEKMKAE